MIIARRQEVKILRIAVLMCNILVRSIMQNEERRGHGIMGEQLTRSDVQKIKEEIEYRKLVVRKKELEAVKEARAQGDLSENFEYKAAKQDKNRNESRIRYLEKMLKNARIVSDVSEDDEVGINNTVDIYFEEDDETETYRLVTSVRGNSLQGLISIESPLGKAIRGHKAGDRVKVKTNGENGYYVVIKKIDKTTDDSQDTLRKY
jgi:transcription elongation factor GreA